ncbi:hypothetical protein HDU67_003423 [Dinochytrium kinnereticum]|nr:hypothetical protein HDU67_003423 [Dinochytrium kinnereticum]
MNDPAAAPVVVVAEKGSPGDTKGFGDGKRNAADPPADTTPERSEKCDEAEEKSVPAVRAVLAVLLVKVEEEEEEEAP